MGKTVTTNFISQTINGIKINTNIPCDPSNYTKQTNRSVSYIVMHYTGNQKDIAKDNAIYFSRPNAKASAHFFVDDDSIYQSVALKDRALHCGANVYYHKSCRNQTSIGIEMCCTDGNYKVSNQTIENSAYLCAYLCGMLGITFKNVDTYVLRHYDVTRKQCPAQMVKKTEWDLFKSKVKDILQDNVIDYNSWTGYVNTKSANLNVRNTPSVIASNIIGSLAKGKEIIIIGERDSWYVINYNGQKAYVSKTYVSKNKPTNATTVNTFQPYKVKVTTKSGLNIRANANTSSKKIGVLSCGQVVQISKVSNGWGYIDNKGWVCLQYTAKI